MTDDEALQWLEQNLEKKMRKVRKQIHDNLSAEEKIFAKNTRFLISPLDGMVNLFVACSDTRSEIRHTGTLAYILKNNPVLLNRFLKKLCKSKVVKTDKVTLTPEYVIDDVRFDFLIERQKDGQKHSIVIEAKVDAKENTYDNVEDQPSAEKKKQLALYKEVLEKHKDKFGAYQLAFLSLETPEKKHENVNYMTWKDVLVLVQAFVCKEAGRKPGGQRKAELAFIQMWINSFLGHVYGYENYRKLTKAEDLRFEELEEWRNYMHAVNQELK